ncbi:tetratricopeptide repeat protein [Oceaniglobus trochenteri]|uniref:tetratricopeptide repeat protein n=1 Tax=Oceaniglobus trochenteri TaxID=2763260 RepID=UPI001CFF59C9|nr:tetratricopeptide repeat protein [Oceaniglobus trochenteri]
MPPLIASLILMLAFAAGAAPAQEDYDSGRATYLAGNHAAALAILEPLARSGHAGARNILADAYDEGNGVEKDHQRALELYQAAAAQGFARASYNLGVLLSEGRPGIPADIAQAIVHYEEAMARDYPAAFNNRGVLHAMGQGGPVDPQAAVAMYRRAHELGDLNGTDNLADMLRRGEGIEQDVQAALALWQGGAERGHAPSVLNLGAMYANGIGVAEDPAAAYALYLLAAQGGVLQAGRNLFAIHADLESPHHDGETALAWCLWALDRAPEAQQGEIEQECKATQATLSPESAERARMRARRLTR